MFKKFLLSFSVIAIFTVYSIYQYNGRAGISGSQFNNNTRTIPAPVAAEPTPAPARNGAGNSDKPAPVSNQENNNPPAVNPIPAANGAYRNGTYTGSLADAYYGNLQVQATIEGGKITDVIFLSYANDRSTSIYINTYAMPILKSEAIQTQKTPVDIVSGATATSDAFNQSLAYALNQAKN